VVREEGLRLSSPDSRRTVEVLAGRDPAGEAVFEQVLVDDLGQGRFRIVATPTLVPGVAAGDTVSFAKDAVTFKVLARGNNLAVQFHGGAGVADDIAERITGIGGILHGQRGDVAVFTVPVRSGFPVIEAALDAICAYHPGVEWYFGNVYDPSDGVTLLNWWVW
jgi:hypothetical protein